MRVWTVTQQWSEVQDTGTYSHWVKTKGVFVKKEDAIAKVKKLVAHTIEKQLCYHVLKDLGWYHDMYLITFRAGYSQGEVRFSIGEEELE